MVDTVVPDTGSEEDLEQARVIASDDGVLPDPAMKGGKCPQAGFDIPCFTAIVEPSELLC